MPKKARSIVYKRLPNDGPFDELRLEGRGGTILRAFTKYRYKTSGMSGDEWRTSVVWEVSNGFLEGGYRDLETACSALYPCLYSSLKYMHNVQIDHCNWMRNGEVMYQSSYDGKPLELIHTAGHLPWGYIQAVESFIEPTSFDNEACCFQPGCAEPPVSEYRLLFVYDRDGGNKRKPNKDIRRKFCQRHLMRGDCGLEDADSNYVVVSGPGPDKAEGWREYESEAVFGGFVDLSDLADG